MSQYMVAYVNLFDNTIEMEQVTAESDWQAIIQSKFMRGVSVNNGMSMVAIKSYFFDCDSIIDAKLIKQLS